MPAQANRILLVEDDPGLAELIGDGLARTGLACEVVTSGRACLAWLATGEADLLLIDYSLPDMTGVALLDELLRQSRPPPPFVVITGRGDEEVAVRVMKLGALDYLVKDARLLGRLPGTVLRLLKEAATHRQLTAAEQALARNEAQLAAIFDHAPIIMLLLDRELKLRRVNRAALEFSRRTADELHGRGAGELLGCVFTADDPRGCDFGPECAKCPLHLAVAGSLATGDTHRRIEAPLRLGRDRTGAVTTFLVSTARVPVNNEPLVLLCLEDVSPQKAVEQRMRQQAALLDVTRDAIMVVDAEGVVRYWNQGAEALYGWSAGEAAGQPLATLIFGQPLSAEATEALHAIRQKGDWSGELRQRSRDGETIFGLCRGVVIQDSKGDARSTLLSVRDITEAKRMEAQLLRAQRLESLGSLAGGVAHDLNNVFTPIMMSSEMLRGLARDEHEREMVKLLGDSVRRGADFVRQLLLFSRGGDSARQDMNVALVIRELRRMMDETFPKNITLSDQAPADLWPVHGDQTQLHQVLLNLCVNARDAMPQGGRLAITAENVQVDEELASRQLKARPGPHVVLRVTDNGTGISPEIMEKIFDPFFTTKPIGQGTGLGLATALGIVRSHGGFITVMSPPKAGSEFCVYLPAKGTVAESKADPAPPQRLRGKGELVLVLDDELSIRRLVQRVLVTHGYQVVAADNGAEALQIVAARGADVRLLITDMMMPAMDGIEAVQALRQKRPQLPVVAISGIPGYRKTLEKLPPPRVHFIPKPFAIDDLLVAMRQAIDDPAATPVRP